jgi:hypothetical protein
MHAVRAVPRTLWRPASRPPPQPARQVLGANRTVVTAAPGQESVILGKGEGAVLAAGHSFAILGREATTTCTVACGAPQPAPGAAAAGGPATAPLRATATMDIGAALGLAPDSPKRLRPPAGAGGPAPAGKRHRPGGTGAQMAGGVGATLAAVQAAPQVSAGEDWLYADCPAKLFLVQ